jgi:hypothetical protein
MPQQRRTAVALVATLIATASFAFIGPSVALAAPSTAPCTVNTVPMFNPGTNPMPTKWTNQAQPPTTIKVRRTSGPDAGKVQTVPFWNYVSTVFRTEFSGGGFAASALRAGAVSVKQYAWYYAINWRGGKVAVYGPDPDGPEGPEVKPLLGYDCYDVIDSTADQLYKPEKPLNGGWVVNNYPYPTNLDAMAATWHISLRKDFLGKKGKPNKIFVSGYRTGQAKPCGYEDGAFRLYQKSVKDCGVKGMTTEEIMRIYYGSNLYIVDVRDHDMFSDWDGDYRGDVGFVDGSSWNTASAGSSGFTNGPSGNVSGNVIDAAAGDVTGIEVPPAEPPTGIPTNPYRKPRTTSNVADLVTLVGGATPKVNVYKSNGTSLSSFAEFDAPNAQQLLVADFDGDMNADVGVVRTSAGGSDWSLRVYRSLGNGNVSTNPIDWWFGPLDLSTTNVMAGDVNTDGKADLVMTDGNSFSVARSPASCLDLSTTGTCKSLPAFKLGDAQSFLNGQGWDAVGGDANAHLVMGDWNRDGRDDVMALVRDGSGVKVVVLKAMPAGEFQSTGQLWANGSTSFDSLRPVAFHGNLDGFADLALLQQTSSGVSEFWLSTTYAGTTQTPNGMTTVGSPAAGQAWSSGFAF